MRRAIQGTATQSIEQVSVMYKEFHLLGKCCLSNNTVSTGFFSLHPKLFCKKGDVKLGRTSQTLTRISGYVISYFTLQINVLIVQSNESLKTEIKDFDSDS